MNWKTLALGSAIAGFGIVGCGGGGGTTTDGGTGGTDGGGGTPVTRTYILSALDSGETLPLDPPTAFGFDLDNMVDGPAGSCQAAADFTSPISSMGGVDNALSTILPTLAGLAGGGGTANDLLNDQVRKGTVLLIIEVSDINDFNNDSSVQVHTQLATLPNTAACTAHTAMADCTGDTANDCNWYAGGDGACIPLQVDASGNIAAGQTFTAGMDLGTVTASIASHRLTAVADTLPLSLSIGGTSVTLALRNLHLGFNITETAATQGEFGAFLREIDLIHVAQMTSLAMGMSDEAVKALLEGFILPDIDPDGAGACQSFSAGFGFSAVAATVE